MTCISWFFSCGPRNEILMQKSAQTDVCIRGNLCSFILLAARKEDPDTLCFQRDLVIEGDTDLGLESVHFRFQVCYCLGYLVRE